MSERMTFSSADDFVQMESALRDAAGAVYATLGRVDNVGGWHSDAGWEGPAADARAALGAAHDQLATIAAQYEALAQDVHSRIPLAEAVSGTVAERGRSTGVGTTSSGGGISASLHDGHQSTQGSDNPLAGVAGFFGGVARGVGNAAHGVADATGAAVHNTLDAAGGAIHGVADATGAAVHGTLDEVGGAVSTVDHGATVAVVGGVAEATGRLGNSVVQAGGDLLGSTRRAANDFRQGVQDGDPGGAVGAVLKDVTGGVSTGLQHIESGSGRATKVVAHGVDRGVIDAASIVGMQGLVAPQVNAAERAMNWAVDQDVKAAHGVTKALGGVVTGLVNVGVWAYRSSPLMPQDPQIWERQTQDNIRGVSTIAHDPPKAASLLTQALIVKPIQDVLSGDPERMGEGATDLVLFAVSFTKVAALAKIASVATIAKVAKMGDLSDAARLGDAEASVGSVTSGSVGRSGGTDAIGGAPDRLGDGPQAVYDTKTGKTARYLNVTGQIPYGASDLSQEAVSLRQAADIFKNTRNISVFEYRGNDGALRTTARLNLQQFQDPTIPQGLHAEKVVGNELLSESVDPYKVTRIYSEYEPCNLNFSLCKDYIAATFKNAKVTYSFEYGDAASRARGKESFAQALLDLEGQAKK